MKNKNILIGITGGIAVYKVVNVISLLKKKGYNVDIIMTENASKFVTPLTFETISKTKVILDMFQEKDNIDVKHISMAEKADIVLIAPATYNIVGKVASGIADDMLSTVISATKAKVVFALAMNTNMYENPIIKDNIEKLKKYGYSFIEADEGLLACGVVGKGRLEKEENIVEYIDNYFKMEKDFSENKESKNKELKGKKLLITAGRTEEPIDPVRYISNKSTGKMGYAIAEKAKEMGADVTMIAGQVSLADIDGIKTIKVKTALQMYEEVMKYYKETDIAIMTAAVSDYRIKEYSEQKIKKSDGDISITLTRNPDILYEMGKMKDTQILVGFAAESENLIENAIKKLRNKNLDLIVANDTSNFAIDTNKISIIDKNLKEYPYERMSKTDTAEKIIKKIVEIFYQK